MNIYDFYFDFADPFSYISGKRLIDFMTEHSIDIDAVRFRSFQLRPNDNNKNPDFIDSQLLITQYKERQDYIDYFNNTIAKEALVSNITMNVEKIISTNSVLAHAGLLFAQQSRLHFDYFLRIMDLHFDKGVDYSKLDTILEVLRALGLDTDNFLENLTSLKREVGRDRFEGLKIGLQGIPSYYEKDNLKLSGIGSNRAFRDLFKLK